LEGPEGILEETRQRIKVEALVLLHKDYAVWLGIFSLVAYALAGVPAILFMTELWMKDSSNE